ncbi:hemerythrin domain-containing protein [Nocardioides renjunii]|uniref:hemerythrin domain-containing protein n=1 Tax=Nocardioides renjunii TaxID=3095075 RepID=UPI002AFE833E|nr:hemerythrin domain-containing protein [Nocardioides sp. S-34]WQQ20457.1 hemerythrin domain-containing protein [Nocardioides sp. S-34]
MPLTAPLSQVMLPGQHAAPEGPVDLQAMYVMHHAFRRDLRRFRAVADRVPATDRQQWRRLQRRWHFFATALHHHHAAEDAGLWPLLLSRIADSPDSRAVDVLRAMAAEHAQIDPLLAECADGFASLATDGTPEARRALQESLEHAWEVLDGHLGHEEREAMALLQRHLDESDWRRLEREHFRPAYTPREMWTVIPWSQEGLPAEVGRRVRAAGGPAVRALWWLSRRSFARNEQAAFGTARDVTAPLAAERDPRHPTSTRQRRTTVVELTRSIDVAVGPDELFAYVSDFNRAHEWRTEVIESTMEPPGSMQAGSLLREVAVVAGRRLVTDTIVDIFEPPRRLTFEHRTGPLPVSGEYVVETPHASATQDEATLHYTLRIHLTGGQRLLAPLLTMTAPRTVQTSLRTLAHVLKAGRAR